MTDNKISSDLLRGHTDTIILRLLMDGDKYGYEISKLIQAYSGGEYELKEATMYSSLKRLEGDGSITSYWGDETQGREGSTSGSPKEGNRSILKTRTIGSTPSVFSTNCYEKTCHRLRQRAEITELYLVFLCVLCGSVVKISDPQLTL